MVGFGVFAGDLVKVGGGVFAGVLVSAGNGMSVAVKVGVEVRVRMALRVGVLVGIRPRLLMVLRVRVHRQQKRNIAPRMMRVSLRRWGARGQARARMSMFIGQPLPSGP